MIPDYCGYCGGEGEIPAEDPEDLPISCPFCDGQGYFYMNKDDANAIMTDPGFYPCSECDGEGLAKSE